MSGGHHRHHGSSASPSSVSSLNSLARCPCHCHPHVLVAHGGSSQGPRASAAPRPPQHVPAAPWPFHTGAQQPQPTTRPRSARGGGGCFAGDGARGGGRGREPQGRRHRLLPGLPHTDLHSYPLLVRNRHRIRKSRTVWCVRDAELVWPSGRNILRNVVLGALDMSNWGPSWKNRSTAEFNLVSWLRFPPVIFSKS